MRIFALNGSRNFGEKVAKLLNTRLDDHEERHFQDGEVKFRPLVSVRSEDVFVIQALQSDEHRSVHDKLCALLFFAATLKDCGARRVTAIVPYLCYARKDRRTKARDPVTMRYVAVLFEAVHIDCVVTFDVHNLQAFQNAFRCQTEHLMAQQLFVNYFEKFLRADERVAVMSPDIGGVKRAEQFRERLSKTLAREVDFAFMEKLRSKDVISGEAVVGELKGKRVIILDDLINSGSTMARAAVACRKAGALGTYAVVTHAVFVPEAIATFQEEALEKIVVTNSVELPEISEISANRKLVVLDAAPIFAEAIHRLHTAGSLVSLMEMENQFA